MAISAFKEPPSAESETPTPPNGTPAVLAPDPEETIVDGLPQPGEDPPAERTPPEGSPSAETDLPEHAGAEDDAALEPSADDIEGTAAEPSAAAEPLSDQPPADDDLPSPAADATLIDMAPVEAALEEIPAPRREDAAFGAAPADATAVDDVEATRVEAALDGDTPPLGEPPVEHEQDPPGSDALHGLVEELYGPLTEMYERLEARLRETPEDVPPVGWAPHLAALAAFREGRVTGDWDVLARLLVAPGSLGEAERDRVRLMQVPDEPAQDQAVREAVRELLAATERGLLLTPSQERANELLGGFQDDPEVSTLLIETGAEEPRESPKPPEGPKTLPREFGSNGTVEFWPVKAAQEPVDPPDEEPSEPTESSEPPSRPAEESGRGSSFRPVGESWRQAWRHEARLLQRGLMWLEQWPRDVATLEAVQAANAGHEAELEAERTRLTSVIDEAREAVAAAERAAADAGTEAERLVAVEQEAEAELAGPRAEADRLQTMADEAATEARERTRSADAAFARCSQIDERTAHAQAELQAAQQQEQSLTQELARARDALPAAADEAERLMAADADAAAEGHATYYRLVSAESAFSARRRKMTLGQRLHVAPPPSDLKRLRAEVKARARDTDEAGKRAKEAKEAAERAERVHRGLATFISEGGPRLAAAKEAQQRLGAELARLAAERETAVREHRGQARLAAEAVDRATQASTEARLAQQAAHVIEERLTAVRAARGEALAAAERARAEAQAATTRVPEAEAALERASAEADAERAAQAADLNTAAEAETRSRENVREILGSDPAADPELISIHQQRAMARIEELNGHLQGEGAPAGADVLLRSADLVAGTPLGYGATHLEAEFDTLIIMGTVSDAEFLIGAVRARRWILIGTPGQPSPGYPEDVPDPLVRGPFERILEAASEPLTGSHSGDVP